RGGDRLGPAAALVPAQTLADQRPGGRGGLGGEPLLNGPEGGAAVLGLHCGEHRGPQVLVAEGTARGTLLLADPGGGERLVPGAEADRGGLVAGHALLPRPGGEGLAGGGAGRGMEGTEIGDDLLLGAAVALARAVGRGLGVGA